nr:ribonuclease H-like domain-containing protein [Tanacetum cinerariifolium]
NPQHALKDKRVIDGGCLRHMTWNMSYLSDFEELNGRYVAFGGNPKGGKISSKGKIKTGKLDFDDVYLVKELKFNLCSVSQMCDKKNSVLFTDTECLVLSPEFKLPDENQVMLKVLRENNKYNVYLKNIVPSGDLTCLFAKATLDESNLWHRRLGHINFKTINKLLKDSLLPIPFWTEAVNAACYVQNRVLVTKPQNKTHYQLLLGRTPSIGFMRPFGCPVTIINTLDPLGKFNGKVDEGFLVGYSVSSKAFRDTNGDAAFEVKEPEFEGKKPESEFHVSPSSSAQTRKHDDKTKREAKGKSHVESSIGYRRLSADTNTFSAAGPSNVVISPTHEKSSCIDTSQYPDDPNMLELEDITYSDDEEDVGVEADFTNLETSITVTTQTRSMSRVAQDQGGLSQINNDDFHTCMFACFLSQEEPKMVHQALKDPSWIEAIKEELLQFKMQKVWVLVDLPYGKRAIAYASFMGFMIYQMDVKSDFLYGTIEEEVYVCQPPGFEDPDYPDKVYKVVKDKYVAEILRKFGMTDRKSVSTLIDTEKPLLKDPDGEDVDVHTCRSMIGSSMCLTSSRPDIMFEVFALAYSNSDYASASLDRKSTTRGCQFLGCILISWQCKKQTVVATSSTKDQTVSGKDSSNPLLADNLPKIIWYSTHHVALMKNWLVQKQTALEGIDCLPNEEIFTELSRMGCEKPSSKLTFYKAFFSPQWKAQVGDPSLYSIKYSSLPLAQKVFANMRRVEKGFSEVDTPLFEGMLVAQQVDESAAEVNVVDVPAVGVADEGAADVNVVVVLTAVDEPSIPSPTPPTQPPPPLQDLPSTSQKLERRNKLKVSKLRRLKRVGTAQRVDTSNDTVKDDDIAKDVVVDAEIEGSVDVQGRQAESQAQIYQINLEHADKVLSIQDDEIEPAELQDVVEVVTTTKLMTEVVTAASATINAAAPILTNVDAPTLTTALSAARRRKEVVDEAYARELEAELNKNIKWDEVIDQVQRKEKNDNVVMRYQALKRKPQTEAQARKNMMIYLTNKIKEQMEEEDSKVLKRLSESQEDKAAEKQKLDKEVEQLRKHLQIVLNNDDDVYTEATPLALKKLVKERFASSKPKNFSDDFLLTTLGAMFEKPDIQAQILRNQRSVRGLEKVKSWKLLESCGVQIITFTTTQLILLVERRYPLTRFTLDQMLNNVILEVEEESKVSLELLRFIRQQQQEGFRPE